jgi:hypothetical protein
MKKLFAWTVLAFILLTGCRITPTECIAYCDRIAQWTTQCKKPMFSPTNCYRHFQAGENDSYQGEAGLICWRKMLSWAPDMNAEFDCTKTEVPEL